MTSVHMRLLGCLEQYQTAQQAYEFGLMYFEILRKMWMIHTRTPILPQ